MNLADQLPIDETQQPTDSAGVAEAIRAANDRRSAIYSVGGGTSLRFGLEARTRGAALLVTGLNRVIDYPARDMTITVEAGVTLSRLAATLRAERQWLPVDAPEPDRATVGGLIASGWNGPRRFGWASLRDYVIGVSAVDGRGVAFRGGGRVVKNVAGYDMCKLLTGSMGTLAVVTQATFKVRPMPDKSALVAADLSESEAVERQLAALMRSRVTPAAVEVVAGPQWADDEALGASGPSAWRMIVGLEGTNAEVDWMVDQLASEMPRIGGVNHPPRVITSDAASSLWSRLRDFSVASDEPLLIQAVVRPSRVVEFIELIRRCDSTASVQSHAGNGVVIARFAAFDAAAVSSSLVKQLHSAAAAFGGHLTVLASRGLGELTRQAAWGGVQPAMHWMDRVKQQFDPQHVLNPGRFVFS